MRGCVKKIYCDNCRRLVKGHEQPTDNKVEVSCSRCGSPIWIWDRIKWKYLAKHIR